MSTFLRSRYTITKGLSGNNTYDVDRATQQAQDNTIAYATAAGDERKLRGIPVLARGVGGTIPGTQPYAALR